jgi:8-oxo-dGTP pyrophosphatase MutT (NUDIX family)
MPVEKAFATTVVLDVSEKKVLMLLRQDFHLWTLPGGGVEPSETPEQAAIRETLEETGYEVVVDDLPNRMTPFLGEIIQDGLVDSSEPFERVQPISFWSLMLIRMMVAGRDAVNWLKRKS